MKGPLCYGCLRRPISNGMDERLHRVEVNWSTLWKIAAFAGVLLVLYLARGVVGAFLVAAVVALALDPLVSFLERRRIPRLLGALIVFLVGIAVLVAVGYSVFPILVTELGNLVTHLNDVLSTLFGVGLPEAALRDVSGSLERALSIISTADVSLTGAIGAVFGRIVLVVATVVLSFYLTVEERGVERLLQVVLPEVYERPVLALFGRFKGRIRKWFGAQLALSLAVGALVALGMWLLGVRYFLAIGLVAAVMEVVPVIGPIVTGALAFLLAISDSAALGIYAIVFFVLVQQFENHVLAPLIMGKSMKVHPVIVVLSVLAGARVAGFVGIVLGVPIAVLAQEIFNYLADRKRQRTGLDL